MSTPSPSDQAPVTVPVVGLSEITSLFVIIGAILASTGLHNDFGLTSRAADLAPLVVAVVTAALTLSRALKHRGAMAANSAVTVAASSAVSASAEAALVREKGTVTPPESWTAPAAPTPMRMTYAVDAPPAGPAAGLPRD